MGSALPWAHTLTEDEGGDELDNCFLLHFLFVDVMSAVHALSCCLAFSTVTTLQLWAEINSPIPRLVLLELLAITTSKWLVHRQNQQQARGCWWLLITPFVFLLFHSCGQFFAVNLLCCTHDGGSHLLVCNLGDSMGKLEAEGRHSPEALRLGSLVFAMENQQRSSLKQGER